MGSVLAVFMKGLKSNTVQSPDVGFPQCSRRTFPLNHPVKDKFMHQNWSVRQTIYERCLAMGLKAPLASSFEKEVKKYLINSGPLWTVQRLKSIRTDIIRLRAGLPPLTWVRKNRRGFWSGIWGQLRREALSSKRGFKVVCNSLTAYSALKPNGPTERHIQSMRENLGRLPVDISNEKFFIPFRVPDIKDGEIQHLLMYSGKSSVNAPVFEGGSVSQDSHLQDELRWFADDENYSHSIRFRNLYSPIIRDLVLPDSSYYSMGSGPPIVSSGRLIPLVKDGGWKVRWIASPYRIHQMALKPFGDRLFELLKSFPWDCTYDQEKAVPILQNVLKQGKTCYCVDLESATDHFPLNFQIHLLRQMNSSALWQESVDLFRTLSRGGWEFRGELVQWKKGQPMGLFPSFASFAVCHGLLLRHLCPASTEYPFLVLGDDVVIWDQTLYQRYSQVLASWNVPVSHSKTIISDKLCEFAGMVITDKESFHNYKWKTIDDENFLALMIQFGRRFRRALTWRQKRVYDAVCSLQPPVGCNHGVTDLVQSVAETDSWAQDREDRGSRVLGFFKWCYKHPVLSRLLNWRRSQVQKTFDEKVVRSIDKTPFKGFRGNFEPFSDVLRAYRCEPDTPNLFVWGTNRPSLLQIYEKALGYPIGRTSFKKKMTPKGCKR